MIDLSSDDSIANTTREGGMRTAANRWFRARTAHQEHHRAAFFTREGRRVGVDHTPVGWPNGPVAEFQLRLTVDVDTGFRCFSRHLGTVSRWDGTAWTPVARSVQLTLAIELWCLITGKDPSQTYDDVMKALAP